MGMAEGLLVEKANLTLALMQDLDDPPVGTTVVMASKLKNGGVIQKLANKEGAEWLRRKDVREEFMRKYGVEVKMKDRTHNVLADFALITFTLMWESLEALEKI